MPKKNLRINIKLPSRYYKLAEKMNGEIVTNHAGAYVLVKKLYPFDYKHGNFRLSEIVKQSFSYSSFTLDNNDELLPVEKLLFIDTETTGLGGSDTVAFLIGCGSMTNKGFEIRQYLLPDYSDESAVLEDLLNEFSPETTLVSYNGAAFDMPLILERMIVNRTASVVKQNKHVDLLHSTRRLFKRRLQSCSLGNIEEKILGFTRHDDVPGYLVPLVYFEWMSNESLQLMPGVLEHNQLDIISLYFLINHINEIYISEGDALSYVDDLHSLSKFHSRKKNYEIVTKIYQKINMLNTQNLCEDMILFYAKNFMKLKDHENAVSLWSSLTDSKSKEGYLANIELAKYYEHKKRDIKSALKYVLKADEISLLTRSEQDNVAQRLNRLNGKLDSF